MAFIISHKYRFIFVHIPKTGGTSICQMANLNGNGLLEDILGSRDEAYPHRHIRTAKVYSNYFRWCILRNPYDRAVSLFHNAAIRFGIQSFKDFVREISEKPIMKQDFIRWPQHYWITYEGKVLIDKAVDFTNLVSETLRLLNGIGVNPVRQFPHLNKRKEKIVWKTYYIPEYRKVIEKVYQKDFELYETQCSHT